jgi:hypothetical protein
MSVFTLRPRTHFAAELVRYEVQSIADAEHGQTKPEHTLIGGRSILIVNGRRTTTQNDACGPVALDLFQWGRTGEDNGKHFKFADTARNQLGILRTEVENSDGLVFHEQFSLIPRRV